MLDWDDEITAVTPSEARAFRKLGAAAPVQSASVNKVMLVGNLSGDNVYDRILEARLRRYLDKIVGPDGLTDSKARTAWGRDSSLLRAAVLSRWLGELRGERFWGLDPRPRLVVSRQLVVRKQSRSGSPRWAPPPHIA